MTADPQSTDAPELLAVEQCDRDIAADYLRDNSEKGWMAGWVKNIREGKLWGGEHPLVLVLARHRIETRPALPDDVAGLVSRLREWIIRNPQWANVSPVIAEAADALERLTPPLSIEDCETNGDLARYWHAKAMEARALPASDDQVEAVARQVVEQMRREGHVSAYAETTALEAARRAALTPSPSRDDVIEECAMAAEANACDNGCAGAIRSMKSSNAL